MSNDSPTRTASKPMLWTGRVLTVLPALLLLFSATMKFAQPEGTEEGFAHLGWPIKLAVVLGVLELVCTILYLVPQTAVLGAILLTGYLGGAIATHVRIEEPVIMHVILGVVIWLGIYLREPRLWPVVPWRR